MTKVPIYLETDLTYLVVTWNLSMMPSIVHWKKKRGEEEEKKGKRFLARERNMQNSLPQLSKT